MLIAAVTNTVSPNMSPIATWLGATDPENFFFVFPILYLIVNALSIIVFNLGFARKLPILKTIVVYVVMFIGNIVITFLALTLPIIESLFVAGLVLGVYKLQLRKHKQEEATPEE
ncbi:YlaH-like family protein [Evansella sp. AB-rgal1]|uniref:YlaH-like family protein n=1 Tax=Evansella sp. AB-rgal1 TaxID=3242696 RepID=UPI00359D5B73